MAKTVVSDKIFDFIKPLDNDELTRMSNADIRDLIYYINIFYLELRDILDFDDDITFGTEIELEDVDISKISKGMKKYSLDDWNICGDGSLDCGCEITSPILYDTKKTWIALKKICDIANNNSIIGKNAGGHIHVGAHVLGDDCNAWMNFVKLWSVYENIIFRFGFGDFITARPNIDRYSSRMKNSFRKIYELDSEKKYYSATTFLSRMQNKKYCAVNFNHIKSFGYKTSDNTIEFRCPNGSKNPVVWQNNINLFVRLILYAKSAEFNHRIIETREKLNKCLYNNANDYDEVYLDQALELCDLIFKTNIEKVYFLRQYIKSFQIGSKDSGYVMAKKFTK